MKIDNVEKWIDFFFHFSKTSNFSLFLIILVFNSLLNLLSALKYKNVQYCGIGKYSRFEFELTKSVVKNFEFYLFSNQFKKLESKLIQHYYS